MSNDLPPLLERMLTIEERLDAVRPEVAETAIDSMREWITARRKQGIDEDDLETLSFWHLGDGAIGFRCRFFTSWVSGGWTPTVP